VIHLRESILETEADFAVLHNLLIKAPSKYDFPVEEMIHKADELLLKLPFTKIIPLCDQKLFKIITCNK
jgi:hypothetical protein